MKFTKKVMNTIVATTTALSICGIQMFTEVQPLTVEAVSIDYLDDLTLYVYDDDMDGVDDYIEVSGCDKSATEVIIPDDILGVPITAIRYMSFYNCSNLTSVSIGNNVTKIGSNAFYKCGSLEKITIPNSVTVIENSAFQDCESLTNMCLPNNITNISNFLFSGCSNLETITLPNDLISIDNYAFKDCISLTNITIPTNVKKIDTGSFNGCSNLEEIILNDNIENIGDYAFSGCLMLESIILPAKLKNIGNSTFSSSGIKSIKFGENIKTIGSMCFLSCKSLDDVYIKNVDNWCNIAFNDQYSNPMYYANNLYVNDEIANTIVLKDTTEKIKQYAFYSCESLEKISITNKDCKIVDDQNTIIKTATIYGYTNSTAQAYTEKYNRSFVSLTDLANNYLLKKAEIEADEYGIVDMNSDGKCNVFDYVIMKRQFAGE